MKKRLEEIVYKDSDELWEILNQTRIAVQRNQNTDWKIIVKCLGCGSMIYSLFTHAEIVDVSQNVEHVGFTCPECRETNFIGSNDIEQMIVEFSQIPMSEWGFFDEGKNNGEPCHDKGGERPDKVVSSRRTAEPKPVADADRQIRPRVRAHGKAESRARKPKKGLSKKTAARKG